MNIDDQVHAYFPGKHQGTPLSFYQSQVKMGLDTGQDGYIW